MSIATHASPVGSSASAAVGGELNLPYNRTRYVRRAADPVRHDAGRQAHQQDRGARFYSLVWPHAQTVLRAAHYLVCNAQEAEDIAQETMLKAYRSLHTFQGGTDARSWLLTILRNTRTDHFRAAAPQAADVSWEQLASEPSDASRDGEPGCVANDWCNPDEILEGFGDRQVISALHNLPDEIRWTLLLVDVEGIDHDVAAKILSVPVGTVKSRAFRGRAMLRQSLLPLAERLHLVR